MSKPQLSSQIKIQRSSSTKIPEAATIPDSKLQKTNREQRDAVSDSQRQHEADSPEIQHSQINRFQEFTTCKKQHSMQNFKPTQNPKFKSVHPTLMFQFVQLSATVGDRTTPLSSGAEAGTFAERMVDDVDPELVEEDAGIDPAEEEWTIRPPPAPPDLQRFSDNVEDRGSAEDGAIVSGIGQSHLWTSGQRLRHRG
ncbi:hypothetical protein PIB30_000695 [Stylosanthes scabra]|uniref:Uncharacterized protein n=1 Tax=Stylosanthes scabra TaxID=79078 RepID=A0ABU6Y1E6_9FABA|nr:hypothetical protein [Stylosanthes scabra]